MKTVLFCAYREWALEIYDYIKERYVDKADLKLVKTENDFKKTIVRVKPDLILFVWWSWIVSRDIVDKYRCVCLHPSPLPKYRGGSPLQHQIISGEKESAVTLFVMNERLDAGPIVWQEAFSLDGDLDMIFSRVMEKGKKGVSKVMEMALKDDEIKGVAQDESKATSFRRRTPAQSEISASDFRDCTAEQLYNKIRALQDPYPNAFIVCKDNTKLKIQKAKVGK